MKVELDSDGKLLVIAESEVEVYALRHWWNEWDKFKSVTFGVCGLNKSPIFGNQK